MSTESDRQLSAPPSEFVYRPISAMAVFCLLGSLVSLASFINPYLIVLAVMVLIVSIATSVRLDRAREEYEGQFLAKLAILIALVASLGAGTKHVITYYALTNEARGYAENYLRTVLADHLEEAFRLRIGPQARAVCKDDVKEILLQYNSNFDAFKKELVTQTLRAGGENSSIEYLGASEMYHVDGLELVGLKFRVTIANEPKKTYEMTLGVHGGVSPAGDWQGRQWYIRGNEDIVEVGSPASQATSNRPLQPAGQETQTPPQP